MTNEELFAAMTLAELEASLMLLILESEIEILFYGNKNGPIYKMFLLANAEMKLRQERAKEAEMSFAA